MSAKVITIATALLLGVATAPAASALSIGHSTGSQGGHFGQHFRRHFGHGDFIVPYLGDWPSDDDEGGTVIATPPPPPEAGLSEPAPTPVCQWRDQTFTVPAGNGGTRKIHVISCP
jgi:hypothetical protein